MFFPGSRYQKSGTYTITITTKTGAIITCASAPLPLPNPILGYHPRQDGQRLDLIANNYLADATTFWRLCDADNSIVPEALASHDLIGIASTANSQG